MNNSNRAKKPSSVLSGQETSLVMAPTMGEPADRAGLREGGKSHGRALPRIGWLCCSPIQRIFPSALRRSSARSLSFSLSHTHFDDFIPLLNHGLLRCTSTPTGFATQPKRVLAPLAPFPSCILSGAPTWRRIWRIWPPTRRGPSALAVVLCRRFGPLWCDFRAGASICSRKWCVLSVFFFISGMMSAKIPFFSGNWSSTLPLFHHFINLKLNTRCRI
jgi:hypothetical protein